MKFAIIGCGFIGRKRAEAASALGDVVAVADADEGRAAALAAAFNARVSDAGAIAVAKEIDIVIVATRHDALSDISVASLEGGKHVLVEKPAGRTLAEVSAIERAALDANRLCKVGYNHRFHPALQKARAIVDAGALGPLMFIRGRYGHGGRPGYEKEWRFERELSGGGELIDQGSHLIDLAHWFLGDFSTCYGVLPTYFWPAEVEDNCFLTLTTAAGQTAWLHATWTEWKNLFSFEIYGRDGKLSIDGLGGSYGVESLTHYRMLPGMGPPETTRWEWPFPDQSWRTELEHFCDAIKTGARPSGDIRDAVSSMRIIEQLYKDASR